MSLMLVLSLQAAAMATPAAPAPSPAVTRGDGPLVPLAFDLARYRSQDGGGCGGAGGADVLVCGRRRGGDYPMDHWARIFGPERPIRAEMDLGGGLQGRIYSDAVPMDRGAVSNRVMVGIRTRF
jgi:hypothetical protein